MMEEYLSRLNAKQRHAATCLSPAVLVNACVGSGKTTVLIARLLYLNREKGIPFHRMAVITFTNKAANEIKERILLSEPSISPEDMKYFGTFHGLALTCLRESEFLEELGFSRDFCVITPEEELELALTLIEQNKYKILYKNRLKKRLEAYAQSPQKQTAQNSKDDFLSLYASLSEEKKRLNMMSFSDLISYFINLNAPLEAISFDHILVDEVQDCDKKQLSMLEVLTKLGKKEQSPASLFAVGDPNQVIYSFRGSCLNVFQTLKRSFGAVECSLTRNYRSSASILSVAGRFKEVGDKLDGVSPVKAPVIIHESYDPFSDALYLSERIAELHEKGVPYQEIAVFYRMQSQSELYQKVFSKNLIPCQLVRRTSVSDVPVLNWLIHLFRLCMNPQDKAAALALLTNKSYGPGLTATKAQKCISAWDPSEPDLLGGFPLASTLRIYPIEKLCGLEAQELFELLNLSENLYPTRSSYPEDKRLVMIFLSDFARNASGQKAVIGFFNHLSLNGTNFDFGKEGDEADSIRLMTLHASKGLEFDYCFIVGVNNGLIPISSKNEIELEEERRLFYVGITRARKELSFTCYTEPGMPGVMPGPSQYLKRIPSELVKSNLKTGPATDFKTLRRMVEEEKRKGTAAWDAESNTSSEQIAASPPKAYDHPRYGKGIIIKEDDLMITVLFEGYGEKEFLKDFI